MHYRVYLLTSGDRILGAQIVDADTDDEALAAAASVIGHYPAVEVWRLSRKVGRVNQPGFGA
jgi:hypothetical protein